MKRIHLDFGNRIILIETESQNEPDVMDMGLKKGKFQKFIPTDINIFSHDSFTFDFEQGLVSVNLDIPGKEELCPEDFIETKAYSFPNLMELFEEFLEELGYAEVHWTEEEMDYLDTIGFLNSLHMI